MDDPRGEGSDIGWLRALVTGVIIVAVGFVAAVELPNYIVVQLTSLTTFTRSVLAAALTVIVVIALAWVLRKLQARGQI